jgi:hypothetical protein
MRPNHLLALAAIALCSCGGPSPTYFSFHHRGTKYYSDLAKDFDRLLQANSHAELTRGRRIAGIDTNLPPLIRSLHPRYILVSTNAVSVMISEGRAGYAVEWGPNYASPSQWGS